MNRSWELAPWADVLYGADGQWWSSQNGCPKFAGLKLSYGREASMKWPDVCSVDIDLTVDRLIAAPAGRVGNGGNSGFQLLNLVAQFGASRIIMVGYDMRIDRGVHWHGHHRGLNNPSQNNVVRWRRVLDGVADQFASWGIEVLNASPVSALQAYPVIDLKEALNAY